MNRKVANPRHQELARVSGREGVAGPLQETIELVVLPDALVIRRSRILKVFRGGRSEKVIPLADLERVELADSGAVTLIPRASADVGPRRTVHGVAGLAILGAWWATMGRQDARLIGAPASYVGPLGVARSGFVLGGPAGLVFVPTGWAGAVDDTLVRVPLSSVQGVQQVGGTYLRVFGDYNGELRLDAGVLSIEQVASWLSRAVETLDETPRVGGVAVWDVVWQLDDREAWLGLLSVARGRLSLKAARPEVPELQVATGRIERLRSDARSADPAFVCRVDGRVHTLRTTGSAAGLKRLEAVLDTSRGGAASDTVDLFRWQRLAGEHRVARLFRGASAEGTLQQVQIKVTTKGVRLRGVPRGAPLSSEQFTEGTRIRVTLPRGRGWQHFAATVKSLEHTFGPAATIEGVELVLVPMADGPRIGEGRRAFHRVTFAEPVSFPVQRLRLTGNAWSEASLIDISAGGFGAVLGEEVSVGDQFRVELPMNEWCPPLEAEVVHCHPVRGSRRSWQAGFRLVGITEKHRTLLQREVLRREREQLIIQRRAERELLDSPPAAYASK